MAESIKWSVDVAAVLGPRVAASGTETIDAYDKIAVALEPAIKDFDVDIQPSGAADDVRLLVITASSYKAKVTFSADAGAKKFILDGPVVLIGVGPVTLLASPPKALRFANPDAKAVDIEILVGRKA